MSKLLREGKVSPFWKMLDSFDIDEINLFTFNLMYRIWIIKIKKILCFFCNEHYLSPINGGQENKRKVYKIKPCLYRLNFDIKQQANI